MNGRKNKLRMLNIINRVRQMGGAVKSKGIEL